MNEYKILLTLTVESEQPIALTYAAQTLAELLETLEFDADAVSEASNAQFSNIARVTKAKVDSTVTGPGSVLRDS